MRAEDSTVSQLLSLHMANSRSILSIPYGPPSTIRSDYLSAKAKVTPEHYRVWPQNKSTKKTTKNGNNKARSERVERRKGGKSFSKETERNHQKFKVPCPTKEKGGDSVGGRERAEDQEGKKIGELDGRLFYPLRKRLNSAPGAH